MNQRQDNSYEKGSVSAELALFLAAIIIPAVQFLSNGSLINFLKEVPQKESAAMMVAHSTPLNLGVNFDLLANAVPAQTFLLPDSVGVVDELNRLTTIAQGNQDPAGNHRCFTTLELLRVDTDDPMNPLDDIVLNQEFSDNGGPVDCQATSLAACQRISLTLFAQEPAPTYSVYLCSWTSASSLPENPIVSKVLIEL